MLRKRGKKGIIVAISFASLALTSVGFSTWIASYQTITEIQGNVTVEVADALRANITLDATVTEGDDSFRFDAAKGDNDGPIINSGTSWEDLDFSFKITVRRQNQTDLFNGLSIKAVGADGDTAISTYFNTYSTGDKPYFYSPFQIGTELPIVNSDGDVYGTTANGTKIAITPKIVDLETTYTVSIGLAWGSYFNKENPSKIAANATSEQINSYFEGLEKLKLLNSGKIKFIITHPATPITTTFDS